MPWIVSVSSICCSGDLYKRSIGHSALFFYVDTNMAASLITTEIKMIIKSRTDVLNYSMSKGRVRIASSLS